MLQQPQPHRSQLSISKTLLLLPKTFVHVNGGHVCFPNSITSSWSSSKQNNNIRTVGYKHGSIKAVAEVGIERGLDDITDLFGKTLLLELVSAELDPKTGLEKPSIKGYAHKIKHEGDVVKYEADFVVPPDFGEVGAVFVENEHHKEMFVHDIVLDGFPAGSVYVNCNSWIHPKFDNKKKRIFFTNKSYLPSQTPNGLIKLREEELETLRGTDDGERKKGERIYDYDVYNDLGNPDGDPNTARPVIGGKQHPYPRRCPEARKIHFQRQGVATSTCLEMKNSRR